MVAPIAQEIVTASSSVTSNCLLFIIYLQRNIVWMEFASAGREVPEMTSGPDDRPAVPKWKDKDKDHGL
jgi:hypothetical protein